MLVWIWLSWPWIWISASLLQFCHKLWFLFLHFSFAVYFLLLSIFQVIFIQALCPDSLPMCFAFITVSLCFHAMNILGKAYEKQLKSFLGFSTWKICIILWVVSAGSPLVGAMLSFNQPGAATHWGLQTLSFIYKPFWIFSFVLVLVCILQGDPVYYMSLYLI